MKTGISALAAVTWLPIAANIPAKAEGGMFFKLAADTVSMFAVTTNTAARNGGVPKCL
ncbi:MAG: hypothetical protein Q4G07_06265 [Oscillospiraceae bacterium]|nr:hypothetical protein [Oscillospiraceae bacterium]